MNAIVKAPTELVGLTPEARASLVMAAAELTELLAAASAQAAQHLTTLLTEDRRMVVAGEDGQAAKEMLTAALLTAAEQVGPAGARMAIYISKDAGPQPLKAKTHIERYRKML